MVIWEDDVVEELFFVDVLNIGQLYLEIDENCFGYFCMLILVILNFQSFFC